MEDVMRTFRLIMPCDNRTKTFIIYSFSLDI